MDHLLVDNPWYLELGSEPALRHCRWREFSLGEDPLLLELRPVLDLVNKALRASKAEEQFIPLQPRGQTIFLVLVSPAMYEQAVRAGLIPG
jgi:hypothetical protein